MMMKIELSHFPQKIYIFSNEISNDDVNVTFYYGKVIISRESISMLIAQMLIVLHIPFRTRIMNLLHYEHVMLF